MEQRAEFHQGNIFQQYTAGVQPISRGAVARRRRNSWGCMAIPGHIHGRSCSWYVDFDVWHGLLLTAAGFWRPEVGIDTFDMKEDEVDLTPWLSVLSDGKDHTYEIRVMGLADDGRGNAVLTTVGNYWVG